MPPGNSPLDSTQVVVLPIDCVGPQDKEHSKLHEAEIDPAAVKPLVYETNWDYFNRVAKAFSDAERRIKNVEWLDGTDVPSINELRYVGYHLLKACQQTDVKLQAEELRRAERHCLRASFDALELEMIFYLEQVKKFKEDYSDFPISDVLSDYVDILQSVRESQEFLGRQAGGEYRDDYYQECESKVKELAAICQRLDLAREEINKKLNHLQRAEQRATRNERIAIAGLIIAVITLLVTWPWSPKESAGNKATAAEHISAKPEAPATESLEKSQSQDKTQTKGKN